MSYTFLLELGEESSAECFSDIPASVLSRLNITAEKSCCSGNVMESFRSSQSGTTCGPLTERHGGGMSISLAVASLARSIQSLEKCTEAKALTAGRIRFASLVKFGRTSYGWRTLQQSLPGISGELSVIWPSWGMMQSGECFPLAPLEHHTHGKGCSFWRTPAASDWKRRNLDWPSVRKPGNPLCLPQQLAQNGFHGYLNPRFLESLMDWPITWTNLQPLETDRFQQWLNSHGKP